jgi:hypothetical protein
VLRLEVMDWAGPTRWRWRLTEADGGAFVADHPVELDAGEWQFEAFTVRVAAHRRGGVAGRPVGPARRHDHRPPRAVRLVLTSRRRPAQLAESMLAEPVHALSLAEAVLLAREWPHLSALLDGTVPGLSPETARGLAARTVAVVQRAPEN